MGPKFHITGALEEEKGKLKMLTLFTGHVLYYAILWVYTEKRLDEDSEKVAMWSQEDRLHQTPSAGMVF